MRRKDFPRSSFHQRFSSAFLLLYLSPSRSLSFAHQFYLTDFNRRFVAFQKSPRKKPSTRPLVGCLLCASMLLKVSQIAIHIFSLFFVVVVVVGRMKCEVRRNSFTYVNPPTEHSTPSSHASTKNQLVLNIPCALALVKL